MAQHGTTTSKLSKRQTQIRSSPLWNFPPEVRTQIYEELLIFKGVWACWPQILQASKEIHKEAGNILYVENTIAVRLSSDGLQAHGKKCGKHQPLHCWYGSREEALQPEWPEFLRRCQWVKFVVDLMREDRYHSVNHNHPFDINRALYSLCSFFREGHRLLSFHVDLGARGSHFTQAAKASIVNPVQLLGLLKRTAFEDSNSGVVEYGNTVHKGNSRLSGAVLQETASVLMEAKAYARLRYQLLPPTSGNPYHPAQTLGYTAQGEAGQARMSELVMHHTNDRYMQLIMILHSAFCDAAWENSIREHATVLESLLDVLDVEEMEKILQYQSGEIKRRFRAFKRARNRRTS